MLYKKQIYKTINDLVILINYFKYIFLINSFKKIHLNIFLRTL